MRKDNYCRIVCYAKYIYSDQKERAQKGILGQTSAGGAASRHTNRKPQASGAQAASRLDLQQVICTQN
jgi:hypothetical protein